MYTYESNEECQRCFNAYVRVCGSACVYVCLLINMGMELFLVFYNFNFMKEKL